MYVRIGRYLNEDDPEDFKRGIDIVIHPYDTWSMDYTLALIIVPMLKQLKETKHGAPLVDTEDVPEHLRPSEEDLHKYKTNGATDANFFRRWDYVLDEMIWAFEQIAEDDNDDQFYDHSECEGIDDFEESVKKLKVDRDGLDAHHERIKTGTRLFGKYYRSLWD